MLDKRTLFTLPIATSSVCKMFIGLDKFIGINTSVARVEAKEVHNVNLYSNHWL